MVKLSLNERIKKFWASVDMSAGPDSCWPLALTGHRYGQFWDGDRRRPVSGHRLAWEFTHGPVPPDLHVLHTCDNPPCCEESHLWLGTHQENQQDMYAKGRGRKAQGDKNGARTKPERLARGISHGRYTKPEATSRGGKSGRTLLYAQPIK
mgnify:CR=1 FL=1